MTLEYMKNKTGNNPTDESTATVKMTVPKINEMLNETSNDKKIEMLNNQTPKEKEMKKTPQPTTKSESVSVPITHEKSDREHTMKLNQSDRDSKTRH
jgi:hypothetical protein